MAWAVKYLKLNLIPELSPYMKFKGHLKTLPGIYLLGQSDCEVKRFPYLWSSHKRWETPSISASHMESAASVTDRVGMVGQS